MTFQELKKKHYHIYIEYQEVHTLFATSDDFNENNDWHNIHSVTDFLDYDSVLDHAETEDVEGLSESEKYTLVNNQGKTLVSDLSIDEMNDYIKKLK